MFRKTAAGGAAVDDEGMFRATIAKLANPDGSKVVDLDGDAYSGPTAFPIGKSVVISAYNHTSWQGALPIGYGTIGANQHSAWVAGKLFLNTTAGQDSYRTIKELSAQGLQEYSYGYDVKDAAFHGPELPEGAKRLIKSLDVFEVSPVLRGAGIGTHTDIIKSSQVDELDEQFQVLSNYKRFLERVIELRDSGYLRPVGAADIANRTMRILAAAQETLRRSA